MPVSKVYLDDDNNIVPESQATQAVETVTDDRGELVEERWLTLAPPDSLAADKIKIVQDAQGMSGGSQGIGLPLWAIVLGTALLVVVIYLVLR